MFQHDQKHTGRSSAIGPATAEILWTYNIGNWLGTSPSVGADKRVYVGTQGGKLIAVDSTGHKKWEFTTNNSIRSAPVIISNGICFGSEDDYYYALTFSGSSLWNPYNAGDAVKGAGTMAGTLIAFPAGSKLVELSVDGHPNWEYKFTGSTSSSPAIGDDGTCYFQTDYGDAVLGVMAVSGGSKRWLYPTSRGGESAPAIGKDGTVYAADYDGDLVALNPSSGHCLWSRHIGNNLRSSPAIGANDTIYVGSDDYKLYAIARDGSIAWSTAPTGDKIFASPVIDGAGNIYIGSLDSTIYSFRKDGVLRWFKKLDGPIEQSAAIGPDGSVYVGTRIGTLYAFPAKSGVTESGSAPLPFALKVAPNPTSGRARISYQLPVAGMVTATIFDATGRLVTTLFEGEQNPGTHELIWNPTSAQSGVYFCRFAVPSETTIHKIILLP